jgi:hypothetical protein
LALPLNDLPSFFNYRELEGVDTPTESSVLARDFAALGVDRIFTGARRAVLTPQQALAIDVRLCRILNGTSDISCPVSANSWCFDGVWVVKRGVIAGVRCRVARRDRFTIVSMSLWGTIETDETASTWTQRDQSYRSRLE